MFVSKHPSAADRVLAGPARRAGASAMALLLALVLAGCAGGPAPPVTDVQAGHGPGALRDRGEDRAAARAQAMAYRAVAARRQYRVPGSPGDPWGPHLREAAARHGVPERWVREIMRQESGGRLHDARGLPVTSPAGAMGLMQVMPQTWDTLRVRHGLGDDPYEPRDNILAGAAYIREMHDRFGAPGFVAAYNAGPERVEGVLSGAQILPDETISYLASVVPRLGREMATSGPMAGSAGATLPVPARGDADPGGGALGSSPNPAGYTTPAADDPSLRAFEGGGLVTPGAPTGVMR